MKKYILGTLLFLVFILIWMMPKLLTYQVMGALADNNVNAFAQHVNRESVTDSLVKGLTSGTTVSKTQEELYRSMAVIASEPKLLMEMLKKTHIPTENLKHGYVDFNNYKISGKSEESGTVSLILHRTRFVFWEVAGLEFSGDIR